jgi:hypothetical protein
MLSPRAVRSASGPLSGPEPAAVARRRTGGRERLAGAGVSPLGWRHGYFPDSGNFLECVFKSPLGYVKSP